MKKWIEQGAEWSDHWAFTTPVKPAIAQVKKSGWVKNPIDQYIQARLEKEGLSPAPAADKTTLLRRLSLDLIGLPPTWDEVRAFEADPDPAAFAKAKGLIKEIAACNGGKAWTQVTVPQTPFTTRVSRTFMLTLVLLVRFLIVFVLTP